MVADRRRQLHASPGLSPRVTRVHGALFSPRLDLHVHVALEGGAVAGVRLSRSPGEAPPHADVEPLLSRLARHLDTGREDLADVPVRLDGVGDFHRRVLDHLHARVKPGEVVTYGELARRLGRPGASRAVGAAMARNPIPLVIPCHRVLASGGRPGHYSGEGGWHTKVKLLALEGAPGFGAPQARLIA